MSEGRREGEGGGVRGLEMCMPRMKAKLGYLNCTHHMMVMW